MQLVFTNQFSTHYPRGENMRIFLLLKIFREIISYLWIIPPCMMRPTTHLPSSLSLRVMPMGSSVFRWNCTSRTRVTLSKLPPPPPSWLRSRWWSESGSLSRRDLWICCKRKIVRRFVIGHQKKKSLWKKRVEKEKVEVMYVILFLGRFVL